MSFHSRNRARYAAQAQQGEANEIGFSICENPDGSLAHGPVSEGTPTSVQINVSCPAGSRFKGLFHTHPGGVAYPSSIDIASAQRVGAEKLCIAVPEKNDLRCYTVQGSRRAR